MKRTRLERAASLATKRPADLHVEVTREDVDDPVALRGVVELLAALLRMPRVGDAQKR